MVKYSFTKYTDIPESEESKEKRKVANDILEHPELKQKLIVRNNDGSIIALIEVHKDYKEYFTDMVDRNYEYLILDES